MTPEKEACWAEERRQVGDLGAGGERKRQEQGGAGETRQRGGSPPQCLVCLLWTWLSCERAGELPGGLKLWKDLI